MTNPARREAGRRRPATAPGLFVVGTDTGVGKTLVSCGLLRLAVEAGTPLLPFKPAESGCPGGRPQDAAALRAAAQRPDLPLERICPFAFRPPVAPAAEALASGQTLTLPALRRAARALSQGAPLLVEGAGGLLSPYSARLTAADLALDLGLPVLLIARNALGTINHTALALAEIRRRGLPLLGLVLVNTQPKRRIAAQKNPELIEALTGVRPDAIVPYFSDARPRRVARFLRLSGVGGRLLRKAGVA